MAKKLDPAVRAFFSAMGKKGGKASSPAKTRAARKNIRKRWAKKEGKS